MVEYLKGFRVLWDDNITHNTKVEIQTNIQTYVDVWNFELVSSNGGQVMLRLYDNSLKNFCAKNDISMRKYNRIK